MEKTDGGVRIDSDKACPMAHENKLTQGEGGQEGRKSLAGGGSSKRKGPEVTV